MSQRNEARYQEVLRRIAARDAAENASSLAPAQLLNHLNVLDILTPTLRRRSLSVILCGVRVRHQSQQGRSCVVVWYRQPDAGSHHTLYLFGIWVLQTDDQNEILIGTKTLPYSASVYVAEAYHTLIKKDYTIYYDDDGSPPEGDALLYQQIYTPKKRLDIRQDIDATVKMWLKTLKQ
ncbi:MAG: hypothetical protein ACPG7F_02810 [Aggregatilineales bacterium]